MKTSKYLTAQEIKELAMVVKDPIYFATFIWVINPVIGKVNFNLYPYQKATILEWLRNRFNIVLKFRQGGLTELISMYCLWLTMYHENKKVQIISIKDQVAKKVLKKIKFMYKNLPGHLKTPIVNGRPGEFGTTSEMVFSNGSFIESLPASENAGRSESLSLLVIDEAAFVPWASTIWASAAPTLSCAVYDTPIIISKSQKEKWDENKIQVIDLGSICPKEKGVTDISNLGLKTFTHTGQWQNILFSQNKGELETWYVEDKYGNIGGYTPEHKLYTTRGWKTVRDIVNKNLYVISVDTKISELKTKPVTVPPDQEIIKSIEGFPNFFVSNLGKTYKKTKEGILKSFPQRMNKDGYLRVFLTNGEKRNTGSQKNQRRDKIFPKTVSKLVVETFLGKVKKGYQVDHINCIRTDNYLSNLRVITVSENVKRSFETSMMGKLSGISGDKMPNLDIRGKILKLHDRGYTYREISKRVYPDKSQGHKFVKRIIEERGSRVYVSKLSLVKKTIENIYDIHVENDHSYISANNYINHNTGGSAILNSTPCGVGNFFHSTWQEAVLGSNGINPIRLFWQMHPDRDEAWYMDMAQKLGPKRTAQEIDGDFLASGNTVFDLADIKAIEDMLSEYPALRTRLNGQFREFGDPVRGKEYFIGADISTGRATDYSAFTCMDKSGEEWVAFKGRISTNKLGKLLGETGKKWNFATLAPETNDIGLAVTSYLQDEGYPNLYYSEKLLRKKGEKRPAVELVPGWLTSGKNRTVIIDGLEKDIREGNVIIKDPFFPSEAYTFIYDAANRPVAMGKHRKNSSVDVDIEGDVYSDDDIFGKAITNHIRKKVQKEIIILPY